MNLAPFSGEEAFRNILDQAQVALGGTFHCMLSAEEQLTHMYRNSYRQSSDPLIAQLLGMAAVPH